MPVAEPVKPAFDPVAAGLRPWVVNPNLPPSRDWIAHPVMPGWQRVGDRVVHGSIPEPIPYHAPSWAGDVGVITKSGRVFNQVTGEPMRNYHKAA